MAVHITTASESSRLLEDAHFQRDWDTLLSQCPWATPFQGRDFISTWYSVYQAQYQPVIVRQYAADGTLAGLLLLACSQDSSQLVVAGAHQAEYHAWLAMPQYGISFIERALETVHEKFPEHSLRFVYLPPSIPTSWITPENPVGQRCVLEPHKRPLMQIGDGSHITASLKKKSNKSRLNRLKRCGELRFEQIFDRTRLEAIFDQIITCYDFRQGAVNRSYPFESDPLKKAFHLALMEIPNLVHMTVLHVGTTIAAANFGLYTPREVNLGVFAQNPLFAKHSPGKFHVFMLGQELAKQNIPILDLTPGGDPWKERFATDHDDVAILTVYPTRAKVWRQNAQQQLLSSVKRTFERIHIAPQTVKTVIEYVHPQKSLRRVKKLWQRSELRLYKATSEQFQSIDPSQKMVKDSLNALLAFHPENGNNRRDEVLAQWLKRLENGNHVYTYVENDRLLYSAWMIEQPKHFFFPEVDQEATFPPNSVLLFDFYTHPQAQERDFYHMSLAQILRDAVALPATQSVYTAIPSENQQLWEAVENLGLMYTYSLFHEVRFGKRRQWTNLPEFQEDGYTPK